MTHPIREGEADIVLGSRLLTHDDLRQGRPWWNYIFNRFLTVLENGVLGLRMSEYHTGYRAFTRRALEAVPFEANSDGFIFDQEIIVQAVRLGFRLKEIPAPARYLPGASSASFAARVVYALGVLRLLIRCMSRRLGTRSHLFESLDSRYSHIP